MHFAMHYTNIVSLMVLVYTASVKQQGVNAHNTHQGSTAHTILHRAVGICNGEKI